MRRHLQVGGVEQQGVWAGYPAPFLYQLNMKWIAAFVVLGLLCVGPAGAAPRSASVNPEPSAPPPIIVTVQSPPKSRDVLAAEAADRTERLKADRDAAGTNQWVVRIGVAQVVVFILQLVVFGYQAQKLRLTVVAADRQSADMKESIAQAARAAAAMETLSASMEKSAAMAAENVALLKERTALQMRAYLSVVIGGAIYQESAKQLRFEARPVIHNSGNTPANGVSYTAKAAILPYPLPGDLQLPEGDVPAVGAVIGPREDRIMFAVVDEMVPDDQVASIKQGTPRALYVWGLLKYKDIFDEEHRTEFCHRLYWLGDTVMGNYAPGRNLAS